MARLLNAGLLPAGYRALPIVVRSSEDEYENMRLEVKTDDASRLAAVVELVSPRNKDQPKAREAFAAKCADHLYRGRGVVVVDTVTTRLTDLHAELLTTIGAEAPTGQAAGLSAVAYRSLGHEADGQLQTWSFALEVGKPLPTAVPLWLNGELAVQLDLEASHTAACSDLGIRQAGLRVVGGAQG